MNSGLARLPRMSFLCPNRKQFRWFFTGLLLAVGYTRRRILLTVP
ncbi:MAG: hypothetical protein WCO94_00875 [Verrucomicrobiota bacterium]